MFIYSGGFKTKKELVSTALSEFIQDYNQLELIDNYKSMRSRRKTIHRAMLLKHKAAWPR